MCTPSRTALHAIATMHAVSTEAKRITPSIFWCAYSETHNTPMSNIAVLVWALAAVDPRTCSHVQSMYRGNGCCSAGADAPIARTSCADTVNVIARFTLTDESKFDANFEGLMESVRREEGTLQYEYFRTNGTSVTVLERYRDMAALSTHAQNPKVQELLQLAEGLQLEILTGAEGFGSCPA